MNLRSVAVAAIAVVVFADAASAQLTRQQREARRQQPELMALSDEYGDCVVRDPTRGANARVVVLEQLTNEELNQQFPRLMNVNCMSDAVINTQQRGGVSGLGFPPEIMQYTLATALVRKDFATPGPANLDSVPALVRRPLDLETDEQIAALPARRREEAERKRTAKIGFRVLSEIGECVSRAAPETVRRWAFVRLGSPEEQAIISEVRPNLAGCIPQGREVRLTPQHLRGATLLNYYRLRQAQTPAATSNEANP